MLYSEFKKLLLSKTQSRKTLDGVPDLNYRTGTAMRKVAKETIPLRLAIQESGSSSILRKVDSTTYIRVPNRPLADTDTMDIDDLLADAVALYVLAGLEPSRAGSYMGMFWEEIEDNNSRLIETSLCAGENDSEFTNASNQFA